MDSARVQRLGHKYRAAATAIAVGPLVAGGKYNVTDKFIFITALVKNNNKNTLSLADGGAIFRGKLIFSFREMKLEVYYISLYI